MSQNMLSWLYEYFIAPAGETSDHEELLHSKNELSSSMFGKPIQVCRDLVILIRQLTWHAPL